MKKIVSRLLYGMFFGFAILLFTACIMLVINSAKQSQSGYEKIEAIVIDDQSEAKSRNYTAIEYSVAPGGSDYYRDETVAYGFEALDTPEKQNLYTRISNNIYSVTDEPDENGRYRTARLRVNGTKLSEFDIREVVNAYIYDNPQIFWMENMFGYAYTGEDTVVEFYSVLSPEECSKHITLFNDRVNEILSLIGPNMSEYERERIIHDKLLSECRYKTGVKVSSDGWQYFTSYGALVTGECVCEGYAKSMQILLNKAGIPCYTIRGEADGVSHIWNVVKLGSNWYHLDSTWDDDDDSISYEYFNVNTEYINKNHTISDDIRNVIERLETDSDNAADEKYNFYVPMCTAMNMNYYYAEGCLIDEFDSRSDEEMIAALVRNAKRGDIFVPIRFGSSMTYSEYMNQLFFEQPYKFYYYVEHANNQLDDAHKIDRNSISVLKNEANMTVRVKMKYIDS